MLSQMNSFPNKIMENVIRLDHVKKDFGLLKVLHDVSLEVKKRRDRQYPRLQRQW